MNEREMEDLIVAYPKEFFPRKEMVLKGRQESFSGVGRFDLLFEDEHHTNMLVELKAVPAKYEHADQLAKYRTALEDRGERNVLMWLIAPVIPPSVRDFLDRIGIEYTEIHEAEYKIVARRHGVALGDEPEKPLLRKSSREVVKAYPVESGDSTDNGSALPNRAPLLEQTASPSQFSRAPGRGTERAIIDAILGAYPYSRGEWLSAKHEVELLQRAKDARLPDGRNAFPAMQNWPGDARIRRMSEHVRQGLARKVPGRSLFMLAEGVPPAAVGVWQEVVDALAAHNIIPRYDVNATSHGVPEA